MGDELANDLQNTADMLDALQGVLGTEIVPQALLAYLGEAGQSEAHLAVLRRALQAQAQAQAQQAQQAQQAPGKGPGMRPVLGR